MGKWFLHANLGEEARAIDNAGFAGDGWDDEKVEQLLQLWEKDISLEDIAEKLDVSEFRIATQVIKNDLVLFDAQFKDAVVEFYR